MEFLSSTAWTEWVQANIEWVLGGAFSLPLLIAGLASLLGGAPDAAVPAEAPAPGPERLEPPPAASAPSAEVAAAPPAEGVPPPSPPVAEAAPEAAIPQPQPEREPEPQPEPEPEPQPEPEPEVPRPEAQPEPEPPAPVRLRDRLSRTREGLVGRLGGLLGGRTVDDALLEELEGLLFTADLGVGTAEKLLDEVKRRARGKDAAVVRDVLREAMLEKLSAVEPKRDPLRTAAKPHVILVLGVNGSGKTTTIGKLAARHARAGARVILGAGDTFRAAAIEQLQVWGERVGCEVIAGQPGGDPAAVAFDTVKAASARGADVAIIDTAGRLQTKQPLMEELGKIARVLGRDVEGAPHETLLVLDSNTGQNALSQARLFTEVTQVTGIALTKLDGTAKGGVIVGLADEFGIPVEYVGVGEGIDDLREFKAEEFVDALFAQD